VTRLVIDDDVEPPRVDEGQAVVDPPPGTAAHHFLSGEAVVRRHSLLGGHHTIGLVEVPLEQHGKVFRPAALGDAQLTPVGCRDGLVSGSRNHESKSPRPRRITCDSFAGCCASRERL
jgi:hypothetical protein